MTKGKTTFEIDHDVPSAVGAALDAMTLAAAWSEGAAEHDEIQEIQRQLRALHQRLRRRPPVAFVTESREGGIVYHDAGRASSP